MNIKKSSWLILAVTMFVLLALFYLNSTNNPGTQPSPMVKQVTTGGITIEDDMGRKVNFPGSPKRIVVLTGYPAEVLCALKAGDRIVGICNPDNEDIPELRAKPSVGNNSSSPDLEKILELRPDLVIAYQWVRKEVVDELEKCQIPVLCYRAWNFDELQFYTEQMGILLEQQARANELRDFIHSRLVMIEERTKKLPPEQRPQVFYESVIPYQTMSSGKYPMDTPWGTFLFVNPEEVKLDLAGGINCIGVQAARTPTLSAEWLLAKNPDAIIKVRRNTERSAVSTTEAMAQVRTEFMQRDGLDNLAAVKAGRVYIIHTKLCAGPRQIVGLCYYARWLHPELFPDLDPQAVHREMLERFWGLKLQGNWGYPE